MTVPFIIQRQATESHERTPYLSALRVPTVTVSSRFHKVSSQIHLLAGFGHCHFLRQCDIYVGFIALFLIT